LGLPNSTQELFLQVAIPIALPDGACGMDEVSNGGFVDNRRSPTKARSETVLSIFEKPVLLAQLHPIQFEPS